MKYIKQKKYSIIETIKNVFKRQKIIDQYKVNEYFIDLYFPEQKLDFEIDENNHLDRCNIKKQKREEMIKNNDIKLIKINPDKKYFDIFDEISRIQDFIFESGIIIGQEMKNNKVVEDLERSLKIVKLNE